MGGNAVAHPQEDLCARPHDRRRVAARYARAAATDGPITVLTFESSGPELAALSEAGSPFFKPPWRPTVVGMVLGARVDWDEVGELLTESYCVLAPKKLVELVERPIG